MDDIFLKELQIDFLKESLSLIERFEQILLEPKESYTKDHIDELFRSAHSIKGGAAAVGLDEISSVTHLFEDYLSRFRNQSENISQVDTFLFFEFCDLIRNDFNSRLNEENITWNPNPFLKNLEDVQKIEKSNSATNNVPSLVVLPEQELNKSTNLSLLKSDTSIQKKSVQQVKVDVNRLEAIFDAIGEVVIFKNLIKNSIKNDSNSSNESFDHLELLIKDLYDKALGLRMTSLQPLFQRLQRTLRDLSTQLDKNVQVKVTGEDTEIDRNLFEQLPDPLIHLIRNAIDHGIENKSERLAAGKPLTAKIEINSYYQSGQVIVEIKDDGRGIHPEKIFEKAKSKKLIPDDSLFSSYTAEQINLFLFLPGFSTASQVSDLSGRGVGLDVVKTTIEKFQGKISITSEFGKGTCFKLSLPLTTSLIDGIIFKIGSSKFIIPNTAIISIDQLKDNQISHSGDQRLYVNCFEKPFLAVDMSTYFFKNSTSKKKSFVSVRSQIGDKIVCFLFDQVMDQCQVVVKPLPKGNQSPDFIGAAITDEGKAQLILDLSSISNNYFNMAQTA